MRERNCGWNRGMEREQKGGERDGEEEKEKEEFMGIKLKRGIVVGKRAGPSTPPPTWSFVGSQDPQNQTHSTSSTAVTARQLGANLWEILPHLPSLSKMSKASSSGLHRYHDHYSNQHGDRKRKGLRIQPVLEEEDPPESESLPDQPGSTGSFHRQIVQSLMRHHRSVDRNGCAIQPVSPASFSSSMEVTPYHQGATPSSSLELKGRIGDSSYSLKTSTELLKVLNRIWNLEEQHATHISLIRALKTELDNSRARVKDLLKEKQMDRQVTDDLMKQLAEDKLARKNVEQERIKSALQSVREELEDERKLRKRSESLHRKLARELSDVKTSFSKSMGELERERGARLLLEELCDEFALGIRDYEQELRSRQHKTEKDQVCSREHVDSLVLHMSEAWLDERLQMKLAEESEEAAAAAAAQNDMVTDKLRSEIEAFLKARAQYSSSRKAEELFSSTGEVKDHQSSIRRRSLESYHLNEATSAPKNADDDDESADSESNCFELMKPVNGFGGNVKTEDTQKKVDCGEVKNDGGRGGGTGMSRLQARFQQHMTRAMLSSGKSQAASSENPAKSKRFGGWVLGSTSHRVECLARNNSSSVEGERIHPEDALVDESHGRLMLAGPTSPVKKWEPKIGLQEPKISESCARSGPSAVKENTLKAKLMEARLEGRQWQSHSKASKG